MLEAVHGPAVVGACAPEVDLRAVHVPACLPKFNALVLKPSPVLRSTNGFACSDASTQKSTQIM